MKGLNGGLAYHPAVYIVPVYQVSCKQDCLPSLFRLFECTAAFQSVCFDPCASIHVLQCVCFSASTTFLQIPILQPRTLRTCSTATCYPCLRSRTHHALYLERCGLDSCYPCVSISNHHAVAVGKCGLELTRPFYACPPDVLDHGLYHRWRRLLPGV